MNGRIDDRMEEYERGFREAVLDLKPDGIEGMVFGDIYLDEHKEWVERVCSDIGVRSLEPLWKMEPRRVIEEFARRPGPVSPGAGGPLPELTAREREVLGQIVRGLSSAEIARETQHHASSDPDVAWMMATRALAIRELLTQEARRLKRTHSGAALVVTGCYAELEPDQATALGVDMVVGNRDKDRIVELVRNLDPTRLVNNASGWTDAGAGHVADVHEVAALAAVLEHPRRNAVLEAGAEDRGIGRRREPPVRAAFSLGVSGMLVRRGRSTPSAEGVDSLGRPGRNQRLPRKRSGLSVNLASAGSL